MWEQILPGLRIKIFMTVLLGVLYPLAITGVSQAVFPHQANGSLVTAGGKLIGSDLIGQAFSKPEYFRPRPSSAGNGYDAASSSGSNLGPTSAKLLRGTTKIDEKKNEVVDYDGVSLRLVHYCVDNGIPYESSVALEQFKDAGGELDDVKLIKAFNDAKSPLRFTAKSPIPADAVTSSASGLDPHISPANAAAQAGRVAKTRGVAVEQVNRLIAAATEGPELGILGESRVNVLRLNLALDRQLSAKR
ncbi:MAG: potassium-transporting ATPase subunit C [Candidatus Solibacter sp.]